MRQPRKVLVGLFFLVIVFIQAATSQQALSRINAGTLTCDIAPGVALIVDSPKDLRCIFHKTDGSNEAYGGKIQGGGLNVGVTGRTVMAWTVMTDTVLVGRGIVSGRYTGVEAGVAIGVGGTGRTLLNATNKAVSLQPLSVKPRTGLNIALGVTEMELYSLGARRSPAIAGPTPIIPDHSDGRQELQPAPERVTPDYVCGSETRLQPAQTLSGLARACKVSLAAVLEANPEIRNVRTIQAGAVIRIPRQKSVGKRGQCGRRTIAARGETLTDIAARCSITVEALSLANPDIKDGSGVVPGQVLEIPDSREAGNKAQSAAVPPSKTAGQDTESAAVPSLERASEQAEPAPPPAEKHRPEVSEAPNVEAEKSLLPSLGDQTRAETEVAEVPETNLTAKTLRARCEEAAAKQLGLRGDQIAAEELVQIDEETYSAELKVGSAQATCQIDRQGQVLSLKLVEKPLDQPLAKPSAYEVIRSRLPEDETLVMMAIPDTGEIREAGRIEGYRSTAYGFYTSASEILDITVESDNADTYFNVVNAEMPYGAALFVGLKEQSSRATVRFSSNGFYLIRPYLHVDAARRNAISNYSVLVSRIGPVISTSPEEADKIDLAPSGKGDLLIPMN